MKSEICIKQRKMGIDKEAEIVERELWDHYSELPNPSWYEYKDKEDDI